MYTSNLCGLMMIKKAVILFALLFTFGLNVQKANAQACTAPAAPTGVTVEYPGCSGSCDLTQADCKWNTQSDATSFNLTVTQVEDGSIIKNNESEPSSTTKVLFPITQGKTYKCSVVAVNSCGGLSAAATDQLLCAADAMISTPTATLVPQATAIPVTATPTIAKPGGIVQTIALGGGILFAIIGGIILLAL